LAQNVFLHLHNLDLAFHLNRQVCSQQQWLPSQFLEYLNKGTLKGGSITVHLASCLTCSD
jgi:hypothetical protein